MSSIQVKKDTMTEDTVIVIQMWLRTKSLDQQAVETDPSVSISSTGHNRSCRSHSQLWWISEYLPLEYD